MGTCLMCHRKIRDGQKYCDSCKQKRKNKADESYLDSLLSSVGGNQKDDTAKAPKINRSFPAYTDNNSISKNIKPEMEKTAKPEDGMQDMISDILDEMGDGVYENEPDSDVKEEDIENIFDEAEAYATLLAKNEYANTQAEDIVDIKDNNETEAESELINFEWEGQSENGNEPLPDDEPLDDGFNEMDEIILNETINTEVDGGGSVQEVFSDFDPLEEEIEADNKPKKKKKKKLSWFKRLFGNVNDEVTPEMIEADKKKKAEKEEEDRKKKAEKKAKEEAKLAELKAEKERKKAEADAERNRKLALSIEKKNAAKEKQRQKREQALAIAEYELEHGKINKAGATILFVIFAVLTIVIIIGTNIFSYNLSLKNARDDFSVKKYNEAYYDVYGYDIKIKESGVEQDIILYDKIMTVMYVKTQLNSYEYFRYQ